MNRFMIQLLLLILGIISFASVLVFEIDGILGFILATIGVVLIGIGLTFRGLIKLFLP